MKLADFYPLQPERAGVVHVQGNRTLHFFPLCKRGGEYIVRALLLAAALILLLTGCGRDAGPPVSARAAFDHEHTLLDEVLQKHVHQGRVDYRALQLDAATLDRYIETLARIEPATYEEWTRAQKLALWINAYNAYTLRVILDHYPVTRSVFADPLRHYPASSIRQIPGVWKLRRWTVAGSTWTLEHMEHTILRRELAEPRVHFVLVCASNGCPLLESRAFGASTLEQRLEQAARNYVQRDGKVQIDRKNRAVRLPQIFNWFAEDFKPIPEFAGHFARRPPKIAGVLTWTYRYASTEERDFLKTGAYGITYLEYDWGLNDGK